MRGGDDHTTADTDEDDLTDEERSRLTAVAEPVVIDLRDGVDTIAAHEADRARRADGARPRR